MKSTYINTRRRSAENINTGPRAMKLAPFIHILAVRGEVKVPGEGGLSAGDDV